MWIHSHPIGDVDLRHHLKQATTEQVEISQKLKIKSHLVCYKLLVVSQQISNNKDLNADEKSYSKKGKI